MTKIIPVAAAWLRDDKDRVLICLRKEEKARGGHWEFPGGKIEKGETPAAALERELMEELNLEVKAGDELIRTIHAYSDIRIELILLEARELGKDRRESLRLTDHDEIVWAPPEQLDGYDLAPADRELLTLLYPPHDRQPAR